MKYKVNCLTVAIVFMLGCGNTSENKTTKANAIIRPGDTTIFKKNTDKVRERELHSFLNLMNYLSALTAEANLILKTTNIASDSLKNLINSRISNLQNFRRGLASLAEVEEVKLNPNLDLIKSTELKSLKALNAEAKSLAYLDLMERQDVDILRLLSLGKHLEWKKIEEFSSKWHIQFSKLYDEVKMLQNQLRSKKAGMGADESRISNQMKNNPARNQ